MTAYELFEKNNDEHCKFERIEHPMSNRPDLHALLLIDMLFPREKNADVICAAEHDVIYIDATSDEIESLSEADIVSLLRCGFFYDSEVDCICSFV